MGENMLCINCFKEIDTSIGEGEICPHCGYNNLNENKKNALPYRTLINDRYIIGKVKVFNSEGFTYLAYDKYELKIVEIREFFPSTIAYRYENQVFSSDNHKNLFHKLYLDFVNLANSLNKIKNLPGIVGICDLVSENNTCYIIYEHYEGVSLKSYLEENDNILSLNDTLTLFEPLMNSLSTVHALGIRHLGISYKTLIVCADGKLRLSEFSTQALRTVGSGIVPDLIKQCVAYEQYSQNLPHLEYTDVYSFASCILYALTGKPPLEVKMRIDDPKLLIPNDIARTLPKNVLKALGGALQVKPKNRTASFESFKMEFIGKTNVKENINSTSIVEDIPVNTVYHSKSRSHPKLWLTASFLASIIFFIFLFNNFVDTSDFSLRSIIAFIEAKYEVELETTVNVPDMVGDYYIDWVQTLDSNPSYKFEIIKEEVFSDTVTAGKIISQNPSGGDSITINGEVTLTVSLGSEERTLPYINGYSYTEVVSLLEAEGLIVEKNLASSSTIPEGYVLWYGGDYNSGDTVIYGTTITVVVSTGD